MPERDNKGKNKSIGEENRIAGAKSKEGAVIESGETVQKALGDVHGLMNKIEEIKAKSEDFAAAHKNRMEEASPNESDASFDTVEKRYTTSISMSEVAAAEKAIMEQAMRDRADANNAELSKQKKDVVGMMAKIREREARERVEAKLQETERKKREPEEAKARMSEVKERRIKQENLMDVARIQHEQTNRALSKDEPQADEKITKIDIIKEISEKIFQKKQEEHRSEEEEARKQAEKEKREELARIEREEREAEQRRVQAEKAAAERRIREEREAEKKRLKAEKAAEEARIKREYAQRQAALEEARRDARIQSRIEADRLKKEQQELRAAIEQERRAKQLAEERERRAKKVAEEQERRARKQAEEEARRERKRAEEEARRARKLAEEEARRARKREEEEARRQRKIAIEKERREKKAAEEQRRKERKAQERAAAIKAKEARAVQEARRREEKANLKAERLRNKEERDLLIAEQRAIQKEKRAREKEERKELARQKIAERQAINKARRGGGIVEIHGVQVATDLMKLPSYTLKTLLGLGKRKAIRNADTEEEKRQIHIEREQAKTAARQEMIEKAADRVDQMKQSKLGQITNEILVFCEMHKKGIFIGIGSVLMAFIIGIGVLNYYTAFEYSYNGATLGYVKHKETVIQITDMVQEARTEETNLQVVVDARKDIAFKRILTINKNLAIDGTDDVLRRMTYMGDLNVKAYGIYVNGQKVGAVQDKETAANVIDKVRDSYVSKKDGSQVVNSYMVEDVQGRTSNTDLRDVYSEDQMVEKLCAVDERTVAYIVAKGDTVESIARDHNISEQQLREDNSGITDDKLQVGSAIVVNEVAPLINVKIVEERTYDKKTQYKTIKKKDEELYEGETSVEQEGKKGLSEITDRTTSLNGEVIDTVTLKNEVSKEPTEKVVLVGIKERPPTEGTGTYIWPAYSGTYTVTSEFKWRWGRQHQGIDMGCPVGTDVLAADGGTVTFSGAMGGYGNLVIIDHGNGMQTYYGHNSSLVVKKGDKVFQGQHIAEAGNTGRSTGPHIHFGVMENGTFYNPRNYLP